jgi:hypothetical protein
LIGWLVILITE